MKILGTGLTRRGLLKRLSLATLALPVLPLGKQIERVQRRRQRRKDLELFENIWIGHC